MWEYNLITLEVVEHQNEWDKIKLLNIVGRLGWELVQIIPNQHGDLVCFFKRELK